MDYHSFYNEHLRIGDNTGHRQKQIVVRRSTTTKVDR